jgi:hypothetical protein
LLPAILLALASCGDDGGSSPDPIHHSALGTWSGTTSEGNWVEAVITSESECCPTFVSGSGRIATPAADTIQVQLHGTNNSSRPYFNFGSAVLGGMYGQFSGTFSDAVTLDGLMLGPEGFGHPPLGPFPAEGEAIILRRE